MTPRALTTLVTGLFDYAGLFPPASHDMAAACEHYARARMGSHAWMLGRIVCPAGKLHKLSEAAAVLMPGTYATSGYREHADILEPWSISAVIDRPLDEALELIDAFDEHHGEEDHGLARVDSIELKATSPGMIDDAIDLIPDDMTPLFEVPTDADPRAGSSRPWPGARRAPRSAAAGSRPTRSRRAGRWRTSCWRAARRAWRSRRRPACTTRSAPSRT